MKSQRASVDSRGISLRLIAAGLLLGAFAVACGEPAVSSFVWSDGSGKSLAFIQSGGFPSGGEGTFDQAHSENRYSLRSALLSSASAGLEIELLRSGTSMPRLSLSLSSDAQGRSPFFLTELSIPDTHSFLVLPLPAGASLASLGLRLVAKPTEGQGSVAVAGIRLVPPFRGLARANDFARLSPGFSLYQRGDSLVATLDEPFPPSALAGPGEGELILEYGPGPAVGPIQIEAPGMRRLSIRTRTEGQVLHLPRSLFPEVLPVLAFSAPASLRLHSFQSPGLSTADSDLLDLGVILALPPPPDSVDFSVYRWDLRPEVLVFDFVDYAAQDRYLKRLAFFVEKKGFEGRLAADGEMAPRHGWNAHDYRAADLARFFEKVRLTSFVLDEPEIRLQKLLFDRGVLAKNGERIVEGRGALISISRESPSWLRNTFMTHESSHGLYFSDPGFRGFVKKTWAEIGQDERWFWKLYFGWMNYDTTNDDLMANEFMAYLYQQPLSKVDEYFKKILPPRLLENHAELGPRIETWMSTWGGSFTAHAKAIGEWLRTHYGFDGGRTWFVN